MVDGVTTRFREADDRVAGVTETVLLLEPPGQLPRRKTVLPLVQLEPALRIPLNPGSLNLLGCPAGVPAAITVFGMLAVPGTGTSLRACLTEPGPGFPFLAPNITVPFTGTSRLTFPCIVTQMLFAGTANQARTACCSLIHSTIPFNSPASDIRGNLNKRTVRLALPRYGPLVLVKCFGISQYQLLCGG